MVEVLGRHLQPAAEVQAALLERVVLDRGAQLLQAHGEVAVAQLVSHDLVQRVLLVGDGTVDVQLRAGDEDGREERESP